jgi:hypothetical protein
MLAPAHERRPRPAGAQRARVLRRRMTATLALCALLSALTAAAWAYWSATATPGSLGAAVAATVGQGATPTATAAAGRKVTVSWGASTLSSGQPVGGYVVKRYDAGSGALQTTLAGCAGTISATSCVETSVPPGQWKYAVTPVLGTNWRGAEGLKSGIATVAAATISLAKTLFGAPLPQSTTGSLSGFADGEGVSYRLDSSTPLTGSPSSVGSAGTAAISSLTIPSTSDGAHTVYALGNASPSASVASIGIVTDTTAPTESDQETPAPNGAGWNSSAPVQVTLSADDGTGSGIGAIRYTTDGSNPVASGTALNYTSALSLSSDTTVKYYVTDLAGNASAVQSRVVRIDAAAPVNVLSLSSVSGGAYVAGTTVYYRGTGAGSFTLTNAVTDAGGSGAVSSATAALSGTSTGWSHSPSVVTTPAAGPYVSASFGWSAGAASSPGESVTSVDTAGNTTTTALTFTPDTTGPGSEALSVNGVAGSGAGTTSASTTGNFSITRTDYTDTGSGLQSSVLTRETATLSSAGGIAAGTCGAYGTPSVLVGAPAQSLAGPSCYRYTLTGTDRVGNVSTTTTIVMVDSTAPSAPALTLSGATGPNTYISGTTVFINDQGANSGGFQVAATTTDTQSGIQSVTFPALLDFTSGGGADPSSPFSTTYAWSGAVAAGGSQTVTATNTVGGSATSTFTVTPDTTAPATGALTVNGSASTSYSTTGSYAIVRTDYTDGGSGLVSSALTRETATLSSAGGIVDGTCGSYGTATVLVGQPAQTLTGPSCYRYTLTGTDQVGNIATTTAIVKVDTSAPTAPALTLSAASGNTYTTGTTAFISPLAGKSGSFTVGATTTDAASGIQKVNFPAPAGFSTGSGDDATSPFGTTYTWSGVVGATGAQTVTATSNATSTATSTFTVTPDVSTPTGGAVTVNSVAASGAGTASFNKTGSFTIASRTDYTADTGSGLLSSVLTVASATLTSVGGAAGTCSAFGTETVVVGTTAQNGMASASCYRYTLTGTDRVGNTSTISTIVKVDTTVPVNVLSLSSVTGGAYLAPGGSTVFYRGAAAGSFKLTNTATDVGGSGLASSATAALTGTATGWTHTGSTVSTPTGGPFVSNTFSWTAATTTSPGETVTSTDGATNTKATALTFSNDATRPTVTAIVSKQADGSAGNGKLENGDQLIITFSEELLPSSVPASSSGTETRPSTCPGSGAVTLTLASINTGAQSTGGCGYLTATGSATFTATPVLTNNGASTDITLTVSGVSGAATAAGTGALVFTPATTILDRVGNTANGPFTTAAGFKLF